MTTDIFKGKAKPLDAYDIAILAHRIDVSEDHMQAFLNVESRGRGFDRHGRPTMLFEPHVFYRHLEGAERDNAVKAGLAYPRWGEKKYPSDSYPRFEEAYEINPRAAIMAASWGSTQILGENYAMVGYDSPEDMLADFMDDEENHVEAMVKYILATGIADDMKAGRWATVARIYNGPGYAKNGYDKKLAAEYAKLRGIPDSGWKPDAPDPDRLTIADAATLRTVQQRLHDLGYPEVGKIDGIWGTKLRAGVLAFRADNGLPIVSDIDQQLLSALMVAPKRQIAETRAEATVGDLRAAGSRTIESSDKAKGAAAVGAAGGGVAAVIDVLKPDELAGQFTGLWGSVQPAIEAMKDMSPYVALGLGAYILYQLFFVDKVRVEDHREGKHVGR